MHPLKTEIILKCNDNAFGQIHAISKENTQDGIETEIVLSNTLLSKIELQDQEQISIYLTQEEAICLSECIEKALFNISHLQTLSKRNNLLEKE